MSAVENFIPRNSRSIAAWIFFPMQFFTCGDSRQVKESFQLLLLLLLLGEMFLYAP